MISSGDGRTYQNLLVSIAGLDGAGVFQQPITQGAFAVVDVGNYAEIAVPLDGDGRDALLERCRNRLRLLLLGGIVPDLTRWQRARRRKARGSRSAILRSRAWPAICTRRYRPGDGEGDGRAGGAESSRREKAVARTQGLPMPMQTWSHQALRVYCPTHPKKGDGHRVTGCAQVIGRLKRVALRFQARTAATLKD